jgi:hypothetical protein
MVEAMVKGAPIQPLARYFEFWLLRLQGVYQIDARLSAEARAFLAEVRRVTPIGLGEVAVSARALRELEADRDAARKGAEVGARVAGNAAVGGPEGPPCVRGAPL